MAWWKALLVNIVALSGAVGFTLLALGAWLDRRQQLAWPMALATVTAYEQGPGHKGRPATYLIGHTSPNDQGQAPFSVEWGMSDLGSGAWVPPADAPPIGSSIRVHVDPRNPSSVALAEGPRVTKTSSTFGYVALIDLSLLAVSIAVWFI